MGQVQSPRSTVHWVALGLFLLALGGCGTADTDEESTGEERPVPIKVSLLRFNKYPSGRYVLDYYLMLSEGWRLTYGNRSREPFGRYCRTPFTAHSIPDRVMRRLVDRMEESGLDELATTPITPGLLDQLGVAQQTASDEVAVRWVIINVETDKVKKTVMLRDNAGSKEAAATFQAVEQEVRKVAVQWTVQVTAEPIEPPPGRGK